jgi:hypothetical protein
MIMVFRSVGIIIMYLFDQFAGAIEKSRVNSAISLVVASLGRPNADGEDEDLTWIPSDSFGTNAQKTLYLYQRTHSTEEHYIDTSNGNECLTYTKYIIDNYDSLPEYAPYS